MKDNIYRT